MRQSVWKQQIEKQARQALFTAKFLLRNKPEDPAIEKLLTRMRENQNESNSGAQETKSDTSAN